MSVTVTVNWPDGSQETIEGVYCKPRDGYFEIVTAIKPKFKARYIPAAALPSDGIFITSDSSDNKKRRREDEE